MKNKNVEILKDTKYGNDGELTGDHKLKRLSLTAHKLLNEHLLWLLWPDSFSLF